MYLFFFFNDTATTEIYTLSLHDALPIYILVPHAPRHDQLGRQRAVDDLDRFTRQPISFPRYRRKRYRSEEHTSELQSRLHLVCRLLLEKKKTSAYTPHLRLAHIFGSRPT